MTSVVRCAALSPHPAVHRAEQGVGPPLRLVGERFKVRHRWLGVQTAVVTCGLYRDMLPHFTEARVAVQNVKVVGCMLSQHKQSRAVKSYKPAGSIGSR